jgi:hypothetical protein
VLLKPEQGRSARFGCFPTISLHQEAPPGTPNIHQIQLRAPAASPSRPRPGDQSRAVPTAYRAPLLGDRLSLPRSRRRQPRPRPQRARRCRRPTVSGRSLARALRLASTAAMGSSSQRRHRHHVILFSCCVLTSGSVLDVLLASTVI